MRMYKQLIILAAVACFNKDDLKRSFNAGNAFGTCVQHCLETGSDTGWRNSKGKCFCANEQDEQELSKPVIILQSPIHVAPTTEKDERKAHKYEDESSYE